jgi:hypothetical protein
VTGFARKLAPRVRPSKVSAVELAGVSRPLSAAVSFVVSFAVIRERPLRPTGHGHPWSRTLPACREREGAHLESVLGATPQEFESPILRHGDLRRRAWVAFARCAISHSVSHFLSQFES